MNIYQKSKKKKNGIELKIAVIHEGKESRYTNDYKLKNKVKTIWIGINNKDVDVLAKNIKCTNKGTEFDVLFKDKNETHHFETRLLGKHNVYNILAAIACGKEFGIDINEGEIKFVIIPLR
mgnify:CR=1 FL=1